MHTTVIAPSAAVVGFFDAAGATGAAGAGGVAATGDGFGAGFGGVAGVTGVGGVVAIAEEIAAGTIPNAPCALAGVDADAFTLPDAVSAAADAARSTGVGTAGDAGMNAGGVKAEVGEATTLLNAARAAENGPCAFGAPGIGRAGSDVLSPEAFGGGGAFVDDTIAITTPAISSAMEHDSAAMTHIGGRRLCRCAMTVRLSLLKAPARGFTEVTRG